MKMTRRIILCIFCAATILISSQAFSQFKVKYLIGTWTPVKVEKFNMLTVPVPAQTPAGRGSTTTENSNLGGPQQQVSRTKEQIDRFIQVEERTPLTINADKTVVKIFHEKTVHAKWKLTKHNTRLVAKGIESGKRIIFDILRLSDTLAVVMGHYPFGDLKITYRKDKSVK